MVPTERLSLVVLSYNIAPHIKKLTIDALESYRPQVKELIVIEDGGSYSEEMRELADIYCFNKGNSGFTFAVNQGLKLATKDFIAIVNSDTRLEHGQLDNLCVKGITTSPVITSQPTIKGFAGSFFVIPRKVLEKTGDFDEEMVVYCSDEDYKRRLKEIGIKSKTVESVRVYHHVAQTVGEARCGIEADKKVYEKKYKIK